MDDQHFFDRAPPVRLSEVAGLSGAELHRGNAELLIDGVATLRSAGPGDIAFFDNPRYEDDLIATRAGACFVAARSAGKVPTATAVLVARRPGDAFADVVRHFYPSAMRPLPVADMSGDRQSGVSTHARIEPDVVLEPGVVIGADAEVGSGTIVMAGAVIGPRVRIGRNCVIGANATIVHSLIGDRVTVHTGAGIGQDGFGYTMSGAGHRKIPQVGRVVVQDDVEIGANTTIDRGALDDTIIGEGTKIDNQVQIGHNVVVGRHCVIVAQVGISGSATLGDFVMIGGQTGIQGHVRIGDGAQVAAISVVRDDLAPGGRYGGTPARPVREWFREHAALQKLAEDYAAGRLRWRPQEGGEE